MLIHWAAAFRAAGLRFVPASFVAASLGVATLTCALSAPVQAFQIAVGQAVRSKSAPAAVKAGAAVIGALQAGRAYPVLKVNGAWLQVELTVAGAPKRGWVAASQVEVAPTGAASSSSMMSSSIAASLLPPPEPP
ncbi:MAG TPA: hypothetical protein VGE52_00350, partial [Pirellulales bacterium]